MNNSTVDAEKEYCDHIDMLPTLIPTIVVGVCICIFNVSTVCMIFCRRSLRKSANYVVVSVLLGCALQGLITAPTYIFKQLDRHQDHMQWLCDFSRVPYFLCGHILKLSLLMVSFDRCIAVRHPYRYLTFVTKKVILLLTMAIWISVIIVDAIPFLPFGKKRNSEGCLYVPTRVWGLTVILSFNVIPFIIIAINYYFTWKVAVNIKFHDYYVRNCLKDAHADEVGTNDPNSPRGIKPNEEIQGDEEECAFEIKDGSRRNTLLGGFCNAKSKNNGTRFSKEFIKLTLDMKATKTSVLLLFVYILCWGPLGLLYLIDNLCQNCLSRDSSLSTARFTVKVISFFSSFLIPIVYCWRTKDFRKEISRFLCRKKGV